MPNFIKFVRATGAALSSFAQTYQRQSSDDRGESVNDAPMIETPNPYLSEDLADRYRDLMDHMILTDWPLLAVAPGHSFHRARTAFRLYVHKFGQVGPESVKGFAWEIARLAEHLLAADTDADRMWATSDITTFVGAKPDEDDDDGPPSEIAMADEMSAFFDAALAGDLDSAVRVVTAVWDRSARWCDSLEMQNALGVEAFLVMAFMNLAGTWATQTTPDLMASLREG